MSTRALPLGGALVFALALASVGCGGSTPPPQVASAPAPAPAAPAANGKASEAACNELLLGASLMGALSKDTPPTTPAATLRSSRHSMAAFLEFRASLKRATELDKSLGPDAEKVDQAMAGPTATLDAGIKALETYTKTMRDIVGDVEKLRGSFATCLPKKDADCAAKKAIDVALERTLWNATLLPRTRAEIQRPELKTPELEAKRGELLQRLSDGEHALIEQQKQGEALKATPEAQPGEVGKVTDTLYAHCGSDLLEKADFATRRPQWITSKEPDLRKMVMVVRVLPEGRMRARLDEWSAASSGVRREVFAGATLGGFGSGFFVMPKQGELLVVTNRHVVDFGDRAVLQLADGTQIPAEILYTDPQADLAVLKPQVKTLPVTYGLGLDPDGAKDRQVVIATGYPGLGAKPSYQTTRGYVSNQRFVDSWDGAAYIQHTAPVDKGGSGGPLTSERNGVLGVNTLKIQERENVAMSVPSSYVADAVAKAQTKADVDTLRQEARATCLDVVAELGTLRPRVSQLFQRISLSMVAETGSAAFNAIANRELGDMLLEDPIDALRAAVVEKMVHDARIAKLSPFETCASPEPDDWEHIATMDRVRFHVRAGGEIKDLVVRREFGRFQVLRFDLLPEAKPEPAKPAKKKAGKKPGFAASTGASTK